MEDPPPPERSFNKWIRNPYVRSAGIATLVTIVLYNFIIFICNSTKTLQLGPNSTVLIDPFHLFVGSLKVEELDASRGLMLYGFNKIPPLDIVDTWSENHQITLPDYTHQEWIHYLNEGSRISISYSLDSPLFSFSTLVIAKGSEQFREWLCDPTNSSIPYSWDFIRGNGTVEIDVYGSATYYIAVFNLYRTVKGELNVTIKALLYNTTDPYYNCTLDQQKCIFGLSFNKGNAAILTSPARIPGVADDVYNVSISYSTRWKTHFVALGLIAVTVVLVSFIVFKIKQRKRPEMSEDQVGDLESTTAPLLVNK